MLTPAPAGHDSPPAAVTRCRCRCVAATALAAAVLVGAACSGPAPDPAQWDGVREALLRAVRELRPINPAQAQEIEHLIAEAESASATTRAAPVWRRDPDWAAAAWNRAAVAAHRHVAEARALQGFQRARLERLLTSVEPRVADAGARIGRSGMRGHEAGLVASARARVGTARRLAEDGRYEAAIEHAAAALELVTELDASWHRQRARFSEPTLLALWREQAQATIDESRRTGRAAIVVDKLHRRLVLYRGGRAVEHFTAEFGNAGLERKLHSGDRATPEGRYRITARKSGGSTKYYLALLIDYPNAEDERRYRQGIANGSIPRSTAIGGLIEIHGGGGTGRDWTDGCVALHNEDMDRLFPQVQVGTPVTIVGTL